MTLVRMYVMLIREVRMIMFQPLMAVRMYMRLTGRIVRGVFMLMVFIMNMFMLMIHRYMHVLV